MSGVGAKGIAAELWTMTREECRAGVGQPVPDLVADNFREGVPLRIHPNPSGLNAHYTVDRLSEHYGRLREAVA